MLTRSEAHHRACLASEKILGDAYRAAEAILAKLDRCPVPSV